MPLDGEDVVNGSTDGRSEGADLANFKVAQFPPSSSRAAKVVE
jgi:hypothetical protein